MKNFEVGDWVFFEYDVVQIVRMSSDGRVIGIKNGIFDVSGNDLKCFKLDLKIKNISNVFKDFEDKIEKIYDSVPLNYPSIRSYLIELWIYACQKKDDDYIVHEVMRVMDEALKDFAKDTEEILNKTIHSTNLLKERLYQEIKYEKISNET